MRFDGMTGDLQLFGDLFVFKPFVPAEREDLLLPGWELVDRLAQPYLDLTTEQLLFDRVDGGLGIFSSLAAEGFFAGHVLEHVEDVVTGDGKQPAVKLK